MDNSIVVNTKNGPVKGRTIDTVLSSNVKAFFGIPFIKPPVGELRFKDPQPCDSWTDIFDATLEKDVAPSFDLLTQKFVGNENSIHLNVFTKEINSKNLLPVMVYIHGGGFIRGSSSTDLYGPDYLLQKDIVLVTFNYRLGLFGFMQFDDPKLEIPGNAGLKDQRMALIWVKNNIQSFGGDPNNITLFGESAGASSVHYHMSSEKSRDLFHRAILMSGACLHSWCITYEAKGVRLAKALGWDGEGGEKKALDFLNTKDAKVLIHAQEELIPLAEKLDKVNTVFAPMIESYVNEQIIISKNPFEMVQNAWGDNIPIIIGVTSDEGLLFHTPLRVVGMKTDPNRDNKTNLVPSEIGLDRNSKTYIDFDEALRKLYYGDVNIKNGTMENNIQYIGDRFITHGVHMAINKRLKNEKANSTYFYRFNFDSQRFNHYKNLTCGPHIRGSCHADDVSYIFKNKFFKETGGLDIKTPEYVTVQRMVGMWTHFAITGNPNCLENENCKWEKINSNQLPYKCLNISDNLSFIDFPETERMKVWDKMFATIDHKVWEKFLTHSKVLK